MENAAIKVTQTPARRRRRLIWLLLPTLLLLSIGLVAVPVFLIQPFRPQTQRALAVSFGLRRFSPIATAIIFISATVIVLWFWNHAQRWWRKALLVLFLALTFVPAWFARQNHFEWMFNPLRHSSYVKAKDAGFVRDSDMVLAVLIKHEAVA